MTAQELNIIAEAIKFHSKPLYTVKEVSEILQTTITRVNELINANLLTSLKLGDRKVTKKHLDEFLNKYDGQDVNEILQRSQRG